MQIQKIQGVNSGTGRNKGVNTGVNTSFGYNPQVNAELVRMFDAQKKNKAYYRYLKDLVTSTNNAEKNLREAERKDKPYLVSALIATFLPAKILLTNMVNALFPAVDYRKKELESYSEEIKQREDIQQNPTHWMNTLVSTLSEHQKQDEAEKMIDVLSTVMHEIFPEQKFDFSGLSPMFRQEYVDNDEEEEDISEDLQKRIELGKSKVFYYEPTTKEELKGFDSLGGMEELKAILNKKIVAPLKDIKQAKYNEEHYGIKMPNGILFYGPPGTGKTTIVERLAVEAGLPLLELTPDSYGSQYVSGNDINIGAAFDYAASIATEEKPVILLMDEIDGIIGSRASGMMQDHEKSKLNVLLRRIQNAQKNNIIVMASTNGYDGVDKAALRRFRQQYYIGLPDLENRKSILKLLLKGTDNGHEIAEDSNAINRMAELTESFPISALEDIVNDAREIANIDLYHTRDITLADLETAFQKPETQEKKINEDLYRTKATRKSIGFNSTTTVVGGPKTIG